jgi:TrpR family trp operon transcriptional repressor
MYTNQMRQDARIKEGYKLFLNCCDQQKTIDELQALFDFFLTPEEKNAIALRATLTKALLQGKLTQREIAARFKISIAKITRGSNMLKLMSNKTKSILIKSLLDEDK